MGVICINGSTGHGVGFRYRGAEGRGHYASLFWPGLVNTVSGGLDSSLNGSGNTVFDETVETVLRRQGVLEHVQKSVGLLRLEEWCIV